MLYNTRIAIHVKKPEYFDILDEHFNKRRLYKNFDVPMDLFSNPSMGTRIEYKNLHMKEYELEFILNSIVSILAPIDNDFVAIADTHRYMETETYCVYYAGDYVKAATLNPDVSPKDYNISLFLPIKNIAEWFRRVKCELTRNEYRVLKSFNYEITNLKTF